MEICQFCKMYMKPFIQSFKEEGFARRYEASCEFCGQIIARGVEGEKWIKSIPTQVKE